MILWRATEHYGKPIKQIHLYFRSPHQTWGRCPHGILQAKTQTLGWPSMDQMLKDNMVFNLKSVYMVTGWTGGAWELIWTVWCLSPQGTERRSSHPSADDSTGPWLSITLACASLLWICLLTPPSVWLPEWVMLTASFARWCRPPEAEQNECSPLLPQHITLVAIH